MIVISEKEKWNNENENDNNVEIMSKWKMKW